MQVRNNVFINCSVGVTVGGGRGIVVENNICEVCDVCVELDSRKSRNPRGGNVNPKPSPDTNLNPKTLPAAHSKRSAQPNPSVPISTPTPNPILTPDHGFLRRGHLLAEGPCGTWGPLRAGAQGLKLPGALPNEG